MFDPVDFLALSRMLVRMEAEEPEAPMRTAISRAYYACLLLAKRVATDQGPPQVRAELKLFDDPAYGEKARIHVAVQEALKDMELSSAADLLRGLAERRGQADYNLVVSLGKTDASEAISIAERIVTHLQGYI